MLRVEGELFSDDFVSFEIFWVVLVNLNLKCFLTLLSSDFDRFILLQDYFFVKFVGFHCPIFGIKSFYGDISAQTHSYILYVLCTLRVVYLESQIDRLALYVNVTLELPLYFTFPFTHEKINEWCVFAFKKIYFDLGNLVALNVDPFYKSVQGWQGITIIIFTSLMLVQVSHKVVLDLKLSWIFFTIVQDTWWELGRKIYLERKSVVHSRYKAVWVIV
jgi:hypothetical protein